MQICNACRYCEGFCAVFPAMTRRLEFGRADVHYLANLCHNCGACLHACQYAPPHEFARQRAARDGAGAPRRPTPTTPGRAALGALYRRNGLALSLALAAALALFLVLGAARPGLAVAGAAGRRLLPRVPARPDGRAVRAGVRASRVLALAIGVRRFCAGCTPGRPARAAPGEATHDVLR